MRGLVGSVVYPIQEIESTLEDLNTLRSIDTATGAQLDGLGSIVGIERGILNDEDYRTRIKAKILINISEGEPEIIITAYSLLTGSSVTFLQEHYPAGVGLMSDGSIPPGQEDLFAELIQSALSAGVRLDSLGYFDPSNPFSFDGAVAPAGGGFGSIYNSAAGGKLAGLYMYGLPFAYNGTDPNTLGYGTVYDPVVGGRFAT